MLNDIFGKNYQEEIFFKVNRDLVYKYKEHTFKSAANMRKIIREICEK
tara:strand:- start:354 stop:497 length:144 start_codon:yes stop_codon:yes gene_type:complete